MVVITYLTFLVQIKLDEWSSEHDEIKEAAVGVAKAVTKIN